MSGQAKLQTACQQVFERTAYMLCEKAEDGQMPADTSFLQGTISYEGVLSGYMTMAGPDEVFSLAGRMAMGDDQVEVSPGAALQELLNIICGSYVHMEDASSDVRLGIPRCSDMSNAEWERGLQAPEAVLLMVESMPVMVKVVESKR